MNIKNKYIKKVGGFFLLKFSTEMLIRMINGTLTHNGSQIYVVLTQNLIKWEKIKI
jgi:hypothetical protein